MPTIEVRDSKTVLIDGANAGSIADVVANHPDYAGSVALTAAARLDEVLATARDAITAARDETHVVKTERDQLKADLAAVTADRNASNEALAKGNANILAARESAQQIVEQLGALSNGLVNTVTTELTKLQNFAHAAITQLRTKTESDEIERQERLKAAQDAKAKAEAEIAALQV